MAKVHTCGTEIQTEGSLRFCEGCGAFNREGGRLPSGTDADANVDAWDAGEVSSAPALAAAA